MPDGDEDFAGIAPSEAETLRALLPGGRDFLRLPDLDAATLLMRLGEARVSRAAVFHRAKADARITRTAEALALKLDGMSEAEREELFAALRRSPLAQEGCEDQ